MELGVDVSKIMWSILRKQQVKLVVASGPEDADTVCVCFCEQRCAFGTGDGSSPLKPGRHWLHLPSAHINPRHLARLRVQADVHDGGLTLPTQSPKVRVQAVTSGTIPNPFRERPAFLQATDLLMQNIEKAFSFCIFLTTHKINAVALGNEP